MVEPAPQVPRAGARPERFIAELLERMTLAEKVGQLVGAVLPAPGADDGLDPDLLAAPPGILAVPLLPAAESSRAVRHVQHQLLTRTRWGIPALPVALAEPSGAPRFPPPMARAATWDVDLVGRMAEAAARASRAAGIACQLAPAVTVAAGPVPTSATGCFGGSAELAAAMVTAHVLGAQGRERDRIDAEHVAAAAVGLGGLGGATAASGMTDLDARTMHSSTLAPARAAVRAGVAMVVPTHGGNDGLPAHVDSALLRRVLREEWEFGGPVVAAPGAIAALVHEHHVAEDLDTARVLAWEAGIDAVLMAVDAPGRGQRIAALVRRGSLPAWLIDEAVAALLRLKWRLDLWGGGPGLPGPGPAASGPVAAPTPVPPAPDLAAPDPAAPDPAAPDPAPPVPAPPSCAGTAALVRHATAESLVLLADPADALPVRSAPLLDVWSPDPLTGAAHGGRALVTALQAALPAARIKLGTSPAVPGGAAPLIAVLPDAAPAAVVAQLRRATDAGRTCVVLLATRVPAAELLDLPVAVLLCWDAVDRQAAAVAAVLTGAAEPGGRLPAELPGGPRPLPLGHGGGYTSFAYSGLEVPDVLPHDGRPLPVRCRVTNTGSRAGKEVVQVYLRDEWASVAVPARVLGAFTTVRLAPGRSSRVALQVPADRFRLWDRSLQEVLEPGTFEVMVGRSAADIRLTACTLLDPLHAPPLVPAPAVPVAPDG